MPESSDKKKKTQKPGVHIKRTKKPTEIGPDNQL